jgi:hypothetical protein
MVEEHLPPYSSFIKEVQEDAERLCEKLDLLLEWRQLSKLIRATIWEGGRPAHRPPAKHIAARNKRIVEQAEFWRKQGRQEKWIKSEICRRYRLSESAVKKILPPLHSRKDT